MSSDSKRQRLKNLLKSDPHCYWCGRLVILGNRNRDGKEYTTRPPNMATLDHIISRINKKWKKGMRNCLVLSCTECNQKRNKKETAMIPKEELWNRSGRHPSCNKGKR